VHCSESGAYDRTAHSIAPAWLCDVLEILTGRGIGLAVWNFQASSGIADRLSSRRSINTTCSWLMSGGLTPRGQEEA